MRRAVSPSTAFLAGALAVVSSSLASSVSPAVRNAVVEAQSLQQVGRWNEANASLARERSDCGTSATGRSCRTLIGFSLGYLAEREAARTGDKALLTRAADHYRAVLEETPDHGPTLNNLALVYQTLGRLPDAEQALRRGMEADRSGSGRAALLLGNLHRQQGRPEEALKAYDEAAGFDPVAEAAKRSIVDVFNDLPVARASELLSRAREWEFAQPQVAETAYLKVIDRALSVDAALAEQAVLRWVALVARKTWDFQQRLARLHPDWAPLADLALYLNSEQAKPRSDSWWLQSLPRRSVLAEVALAMAKTADAKSAGRAVNRLELALSWCPTYGEYRSAALRGQRVARLELGRELIALYAQHPGFDAGASKQRRLVGELFSGKGGAYEADDDEAIQRFHLTLGQVYADRGTWAGDGPTNARFQLENVLRAAERRERQSGYYQPLPDVKAQLAQGYAILHRDELARSMHLQAAQAYLDADQLVLANQQLLKAASPVEEERRRSRLVGHIQLTRAVIDAAEGASLDPISPRYAFHRGGDHAWLFESATSDTPFVRRQRFKALADLAVRSQTAGRTTPAAGFAAQAFAVSLSLPVLSGTADLVRLEKVKELATEPFAFAQRRLDVTAQAPAKVFEGKAWVLYVPAEERPLYAKTGPDAVLAGRVAVAWRADPVLADKELRFAVDRGHVELTYRPDDFLRGRSSLDKLRAVEGVESLAMNPSMR